MCFVFNFNPNVPSGPVHPYRLNKSISNLGVSGALFHFYQFRILVNIPFSKQ